MANKLYYKHVDALGKNFTENLGSITYTATDLQNTLTGAAANVDELCRALNSLSTNTYKESYVVDTLKIDEILAEG